MKLRTLLTVGLTLMMSLLSGAEVPLKAVAEDVVAKLPSGGRGLVISSDGTLVLPVTAIGSQTVMKLEIGGRVVTGTVSYLASKHGLAIVELPDGDYFTLELGDLSLVHEGDTLETVEGPCEVQDLETDPVKNEQYALINQAYQRELLGAPVFDSNYKAVGVIVGEGPNGASQSRVLSSRSVKLALFDAKWPALKSRLHPELPGGVNLNGAAIGSDGKLEDSRVEKWDFPFGNEGRARTGTLLKLQEWRANTGAQASRLAPLLVDTQDRLYLATLQGTVYCLDFDERRMLWRTPLDPGGVVLFSPIAAGDQVIVTNGALGLWSLAKARTGILEIDLLQDIAGRVDHSLALNSGKIYALEDHGNERWTLATRFSSPTLLVGQKLLFSGLGVMGAVHAQSGQLQWAQESQQGRSKAVWYSLQASDGNTAYGLSVPVKVHGGIESEERLHLRGEDDVTVFALDIPSGRTTWSRQLRDTDNTLRPLGLRIDFSDGLLHITLAGERLGLKAADGTEVYGYTRKDRALTDRVTMNNGVFYSADEEALYAVQASTGSIKWRVPASGPVAAPVFHDGVVYGTTHHGLHAVDATSGEKLWTYPTENRLSGGAFVRNGYLYAASLEGVLLRVRLPE